MFKKIIFLLVPPILFFLIGLHTISHYGINWDEPDHYMRGQTFLWYFLTGKNNYEGLPRIKNHYYKDGRAKIPKGVVYEDDASFRRSFYQKDDESGRFSYASYIAIPGTHPPLNGILASLFNYIFYQKWGIFGDIESYHLFVLLVSSLLVFLVFLFVKEEYGLFAGIIAFLSLSLYPLFFSESHFNIKDPIESSFYGWTIYCFYKGIKRNSWRWIVGCSIFSGFALGTKFNIFFGLITIFLWLLIVRGFSKKIIVSLIFYPVIMFGIFFIFYPNLWVDPIGGMVDVFSYYKGVGYGTVYQSKEYITFFGINTFPAQWVFYTTPLVILSLSGLGILYAFKYGLKEKHKTSLLVLIWFLMPIARVSLPNTGIYGGARQIMEYIPAMSILAGIGAHYIIRRIKNIITKKLIGFVLILFFLPITFKIVSIHPNENVYFNSLMGGLKGAREKDFPDWGVTLGIVYKQGIDWINKNAPKNSNLALVKGLLPNVPAIYIREDISFGERYYSASKKNGEYLMEVIDYNWELSIEEEKRLYIESLPVVFEVKVDEVAILKIWKNE